MSKSMKVVLLTILVILAPSFGMMSAATPVMSDWEACMSYLDEAQIYVDADWTKKGMQIICVQLLNNGHILIEREDKRDIHIYFTHVGENTPIFL